MQGTDRDDMLVGGAGQNSLLGGNGNDILFDGQGQDRLTGGAGADVFMLEADGVRDVITDFQAGVDRVDLTLVPMLYSADQMTIETTSWGPGW